jgi:MarR family transcriptional regulator, transcriptional regulator for hemolysin
MTETETQTKPPRKRKRPEETHFRFGYLVHDVSRTRRTLIDHWMKPLGITRAQWSLLSALSRGGNDGMMQVDLARLLEVGKVTIGGLVDRLEASGHVERRADPQDRRAKRVYVTDQGWNMIRSMIAVAEKMNKKVMDGISDRDLAAVEHVLLVVKNNIRDALKER